MSLTQLSDARSNGRSIHNSPEAQDTIYVREIRVLVVALALFLTPALQGQSLAPRAYLITPVGSNAVTVTSNFYNGAILFDSTSPLTDASGNISLIVPTYYRALDFFGRSANIALGVSYSVGSFEALVVNQRVAAYRSGIGDAAVRFSVNLIGGPAMKLPQFMKWKQKRLLGVSLVMGIPTGQYDPTRLINIGSNRWSFKPEVGFSQRWGKWILDSYVGVWFFTTNPEFFSHNSYFPGTRSQTQESIGVIEGHLSYDFKPRLWVSVDGNFWYGGRTSLDGVQNPNTLQKNSRVGATAAVPISKHQSLKFSYARGAYVRYGGDYQAIAFAWQYAWVSNTRK